MNVIKTLPLALLLAGSSGIALADTPIRVTQALDANASVHLANVSGEINVSGWDEERIEITGSLGDGAKPLIIEGDEHDLRIRVEAAEKGGWLHWGSESHMKPTRLDVRLPRGVALDIDVVSANAQLTNLEGGKITIDSVSGRVSTEAHASALSVDSVSGNVAFRGTAATIDIETVSGDIAVPAAGNARTTLETVSGNVRYAGDATPAIEASSVSGDLTIATDVAPDGRLSIETMSGDVTLELASDVSVTLRAKTFSGDITSAFGQSREAEHGPGSSLETTLGNGDGSVRVETFSGDVRIRARDAHDS